MEGTLRGFASGMCERAFAFACAGTGTCKYGPSPFIHSCKRDRKVMATGSLDPKSTRDSKEKVYAGLCQSKRPITPERNCKADRSEVNQKHPFQTTNPRERRKSCEVSRQSVSVDIYPPFEIHVKKEQRHPNPIPRVPLTLSDTKSP